MCRVGSSWEVEASTFLDDEPYINNKHQEMPHRDLDPHARPPEQIKDLYKRYQKLKGNALPKDVDLVDLQRDHACLVNIGEISVNEQEQTFEAFIKEEPMVMKSTTFPRPIYGHEAMPGNTTN